VHVGAITIGSTVASRATLQQQELAAQGITNVKIITIPGTATDLTPYVTQSSGAQCLIQASSSATQLDEFGTALTRRAFTSSTSFRRLRSQRSHRGAAGRMGGSAGSHLHRLPILAGLEDIRGCGRQIWRPRGFNNTQAPYGTAAGVWSSMAILANVITYVAQHHHGAVTAAISRRR